MEKEMKALRQAHEKRVAELEKLAADQAAVVELQEAQLTTAHDQLKDMEHVRANLAGSVEALTQELQEQERHASSLEGRLAEKLATIKEQEHELAELEKEVEIEK